MTPPANKQASDPYSDIAQQDPYADISMSYNAPDASKKKEPEKTWYQKQNAPNRFAISFDTGFGIPQSAIEHPSDLYKGPAIVGKEALEFGRDVAQGGLGNALSTQALHPSLEIQSLKQMYDSMSEQEQQLIDRAYTLQHSPGFKNKSTGFALGLYSAIPILGPAIVNALDQWHNKDRAGAIGSFVAIGTQLGAQHAAPKLAEILPDLPLSDKVSLRRTAQGLTGSGPEATTEKMLETQKTKQAQVNETQAEINERTAKANELRTKKAEKAHAKATTKRDAENRAITEESFKTAGEQKANYDRQFEEQEAAYQKSLREHDAKHQKNVTDTIAHNAEQARLRAQQDTLTRQIDTDSVQLGKQIEDVESKAYQHGDQLFNDVRSDVQGVTTPSDPLIASVKSAQENILQGIPENVKEFNRIMQMEGTEELNQLRKDVMTGQGMQGDYDALPPQQKALVDQIAQKWGGSISPNELLDWNKLQALKTRLDFRIRSRSTRPIIKRALRSVRDDVVDNMGNIVATAEQQQGAAAKSIHKKWTDARSFWRQMREDFHEPQGPSGSGSPVAQSFNAVDPQNIRDPFIRKENTINNRGVDTLRKYPQFGGTQAADTAERIVKSNKELKDLPKAKEAKPIPQRPAPPERPKPIEKPKPVEAEYKPPVEKPTVELKEPRQLKGVKPVTAEGITNKKAAMLREAAISWGKLHTYDLGIFASSAIAPLFYHEWLPLLADPAFVIARKSFGKVLSRPKVRAWIAKPLPEEIAAINNMSEDLKVDVRQGLKRFIDEEQGHGRKVDIDPQVGRLLTGTVASQMNKRNPAQQIEDLRGIQQKHGSNPHLPAGAGE